MNPLVSARHFEGVAALVGRPGRDTGRDEAPLCPCGQGAGKRSVFFARQQLALDLGNWEMVKRNEDRIGGLAERRRQQHDQRQPVSMHGALPEISKMQPIIRRCSGRRSGD